MKKDIFASDALEIVSEHSKINVQSHKFIRIKTNGGFVRIWLSDILYIKCEAYILDLYLKGGQVISCAGLLKKIEAKLAYCYFVRINRNIILNGLYIEGIVKKSNSDCKTIKLSNNEEFTISRRRWKTLKEDFLEFVNEVKCPKQE